MADNKPINWAFPFKLKGAAGEASKDITNPEIYYAALAQAKDGFYPMGASGNWHGGVHFDEGTGTVLDQSEVRCIADGEVIAYRIDESYPTTTYGEVPTVVHLPFSTGFVLVKHRLELPPKSSEPTAGATSDTAPAAPALTFYSLYMHLQDWASYQAQPTLPRPGFWGDGLCKVKADAPDKLLGLNVHAHHKTPLDDPLHAEYDHILATLPRGTTVVTGEASGGMLKVVSVTPAIDGLEPNTGWVHKSYMKNLGANQYLIGEKAEDVLVPLQSGANVRSALIDSSRDVLAWLPKGAQLRISDEGATSKYRKLVEIISGHSVPALTADSSGKLPGFVWLDSLEITHEPKAHDGSVVVLDQPTAIKAGELIGHIGKYQNFDDSHPRSMLHLEVFSCEDVPTFINQSRAWAESLSAEQKTLIKIHEGSTVIQPTTADTQIASGTNVRVAADSPTEGCWAKVQPYVELKAKKAGFGDFDSAHNRYPMDSTKKTELATEFGLDVSELPDTVDFLLQSFKDDGSDMYAGKVNIPSTHVRRKIGVRLNTPIWVKRSTLNAQGQRASTNGALDAWKSFPLSQASDGQACGFERILSKASWNDLSADHKAIDANTEKTHWWYVTVANAAGQEILGWVPQADLIITEHSPWEWPGFSLIEDITPIVSRLAGTLSAEGTLSTEETRSYAAQIDEAERGALFQRLFEIIDQPDAAGVRDKKLTSAEIKNALSKPWLAQKLSLLITHYESEWFWQEDKWDELDKLMGHTPAVQNLNWVREKERIQKMSWWSEIAGAHGISMSGKPWHIHSIGLLASYGSKQELVNIDKFIETYTPLHPTFNSTADLGSTSKENLKEFLKNINKYYSEHDEKPNRYELSYMLATARHEMYHFPTGEYFSKKPEVGDYHYFDKYDPVLADTAPKRQNAIDHENTAEGDGFKYRGRGPVHLTWKVNYRRAMEKFGPDFVNNPDLAADFENSVPIMIWGMKTGMFTGKNIGDYINSTTVDYEEARRVINGVDQKVLIASYAKKFEEILKESSTASTEF